MDMFPQTTKQQKRLWIYSLARKNNNLQTMIIHSRKDMKCPFFMGEELFNAIPHENKRFEIYDESEHLFAYWDESERYIESVISFIEEFK